MGDRPLMGTVTDLTPRIPCRREQAWRQETSARVRAARAALGLTVEEFTAALTDATGWTVSVGAVRRWEAGAVAPGDVVLWCLAAAGHQPPAPAGGTPPALVPFRGPVPVTFRAPPALPGGTQ